MLKDSLTALNFSSLLVAGLRLLAAERLQSLVSSLLLVAGLRLLKNVKIWFEINLVILLTWIRMKSIRILTPGLFSKHDPGENIYQHQII